MATRIFIIDDEPHMARMAEDILKDNNYEVTVENDPLEGIKRIQESLPDLLLLDLRMPTCDGYEVCKRLKKDPRTQELPIVIVSVKNEEADVVAGLELGAEDYIHKPFRERELIARVKTILRRRDIKPAPQHIKEGPLFMDLNTYQVTVNNKPLKLHPKEFQLLAFFVQRQGHVLTRATLSEHVWGTGHLPTSRTIDTHVDSLRKKLKKYKKWIKSLRGVGYRFEIEE